MGFGMGFGSRDDSRAPARSNASGGGGGAQDAEAVWVRHRRWVAAILLAHKPREADIDDLLQTVAHTVAGKLDGLQGGEASVKAWLRTVAINTARAAGRKAKVRRRYLSLVREGFEPVPAAETAPRDAEALERGRRLLDLSRALPEKYREPLLLRCVQGMSYRQIGEVLGLPETTIETRIARGRKMLREAAENAERPAASAVEINEPAAVTACEME
jgi:RNA polymerase sigma-70 factor (ECF subfamily)